MRVGLGLSAGRDRRTLARMRPQFHLLGFAGLQRGATWPHWVAICFEPIATPVGIAEGIGQGAGGRLMTAAEAISGAWDRNFHAAGASWLIPYLRRLAEGTPLPRDEMLAKYREIHGSPPALSDFGDCLPP